MDPLVELLLDDEGEGLHSAADVEAFAAALNREVEACASSSISFTVPAAPASSSSSHPPDLAAVLGKEGKRKDGSPWADLPRDLLADMIMSTLDPRDRAAVRLVCSPWRECVRRPEVPFEAPRLVFRRPGQGGGLALYSLHRRDVLPFALPTRFSAGRCCGHIAGWLAMALDADRAIALYNPSTGESVHLPRAPVFPVSKIIFSAPPSSSSSASWTAAALGRSGTVVVLRPGVPTRAWMILDEGSKHGGFCDMAFWNGSLCALGYDGAVVVLCNGLGARTTETPTTATATATPSDPSLLLRDVDPSWRLWPWQYMWQYMVECEGQLVLVRRLADYSVEVLWLAAPAERVWHRMALHGGALVVGSVASAVVPAAAGVRENCVYVARRVPEMLAPAAISEYSLEGDKMTEIPIVGGHCTDVEPVWITPFV